MAGFIAKIKLPSGEIVHSSPQIANAFKDFYSALYNIKDINSLTDNSKNKSELIQDFLEQANLPKLPELELEELEEDFTIDEFKQALASLPVGKAPGPDRFTVAYYRTFGEILLPKLTKYANSIDSSRGLRSETLGANIVVIPKPGKDPTCCGSYRSISLLNVDVKLYAKVLATRLMHLLPKWVS